MWLQPPLRYITGTVRKLDALCLMPHTPRGIVTWSDGLCLMRYATPWSVICERSNGNLWALERFPFEFPALIGESWPGSGYLQPRAYHRDISCSTRRGGGEEGGAGVQHHDLYKARSPDRTKLQSNGTLNYTKLWILVHASVEAIKLG